MWSFGQLDFEGSTQFMCNYEESCEKPLLERKGNLDIFTASLSSTLKSGGNDRVGGEGSHTILFLHIIPFFLVCIWLVMQCFLVC